MHLQGGTTFQLRSADGGIGVIGSDARVWIRNSGGGLLVHNDSYLSPQKSKKARILWLFVWFVPIPLLVDVC